MKSFAQYVVEEEETYKPPAAAAKNAQKALDWKEEHGDDEVTAMTRTGWIRAGQLADRDELSYDVVSRMAAFARHKKNSKISPKYKDTPWKDNGYVAWLGWGGDAGVEWAQKIVDKKDKEKDS